MHANVKVDKQKSQLRVTIRHSLDTTMYNVPLTLKTYVDPAWREITVKQGRRSSKMKPSKDSRGSYVLYQALPNSAPVELMKSR